MIFLFTFDFFLPSVVQLALQLLARAHLSVEASQVQSLTLAIGKGSPYLNLSPPMQAYPTGLFQGSFGCDSQVEHILCMLKRLSGNRYWQRHCLRPWCSAASKIIPY